MKPLKQIRRKDAVQDRALVLARIDGWPTVLRSTVGVRIAMKAPLGCAFSKRFGDFPADTSETREKNSHTRHKNATAFSQSHDKVGTKAYLQAKAFKSSTIVIHRQLFFRLVIQGRFVAAGIIRVFPVTRSDRENDARK